MDAELYARVTALFHQAVELPEPERLRFVEANDGGDLSLRDAVLAMLAADNAMVGDGNALLDRSLGEIASDLIENEEDPPLSEEFGPYRLKEILGQGGMGVVWLAERVDAGKLVAIKFLLHAGLSPVRFERFQREIKTLARLEHPFIARFYDAGILADQTPWLVMEYVKGERIDEYCASRRLPLLERLRLFRMICDAVQYAQAQAILHRDLKPSNILVAQDGTPRLLDFGIAKELDSAIDSGIDQDERTSPALRFLTWDYAAPEWVSEGSQGLYTDVYSLGVILYQLLTGRLPFDRSKIPQGEFAAHVAGNDPDKPSFANGRARESGEAGQSGLPAGKIGKSAWSELDLLCLKAMHRDVKQRYPSVEALGRDIDHFLRGEALEARPDSFGYRLSKFVRRNRRAVLATAATLAVIAGLIVFYTVRLTKARDAALNEAARTRRTQQFMLNLLGGTDQKAAPSADLRVVTLLDHGMQEAATLGADTEAQSDLYENLGNMYDMLGDYPKAEKLLWLALDRRKRTTDPDDVKVAEVLERIAVVKGDEGMFDDAEQSAQQGLDLLSRHLPADDARVLAAKTTLGTVIAEYGDFNQAIPLLQPLAGRKPTGDERDYSLSEALGSLAICEYAIGKIELADSLNNRALDLDRRLFGATHPRVSDDLITAGMTKAAVSKGVEAERDYRQATAIETAWYGRGHPSVADDEVLLASVLVDEHKEDEAEGLLRDTIQTYQRVWGSDDGHLAKPLALLARIEMSHGQLARAEADTARAVAIALPVYGEDGYQSAVFSAQLGEVYRRERQYDRADAILSKAVKALLAQRAPSPWNGATARLAWGRTLLALKRYPEAERELAAAYGILKVEHGTSLEELQKIRANLVAAYVAMHEPEKAKAVEAEMAGANAMHAGSLQPK